MWCLLNRLITGSLKRKETIPVTTFKELTTEDDDVTTVGHVGSVKKLILIIDFNTI